MALSFRAATAADIPALRDVFGHDPSEEQLGLAAGAEGRARRFRELMANQVVNSQTLRRTTVAMDDGDVVGFVQAGAEGGLSFALVLGIIRVFGLGVVAFLHRDRARSRVHLPSPPGSYHIAEIHVLSTRRNRGIGKALLEEAERDARSRGFAMMSLTTTTSNPARNLYERFGFDLVEERTDASYLAITGIAGRILMVKKLG